MTLNILVQNFLGLINCFLLVLYLLNTTIFFLFPNPTVSGD